MTSLLNLSCFGGFLQLSDQWFQKLKATDGDVTNIGNHFYRAIAMVQEEISVHQITQFPQFIIGEQHNGGTMLWSNGLTLTTKLEVSLGYTSQFRLVSKLWEVLVDIFRTKLIFSMCTCA